MRSLASHRDLLAVILVALVVRLGSVGWLHAGGYTSDEREYITMAKSLEAGGEFIDSNGERSTRAPLFPFVLSLVFRVAGPDVVVAHAIGSLLGVLVVVLSYLLSLRILNDRFAALCSAGMAALYPGLIIFAGLLQTETTYTMFLLVAMLSVYASIENKSVTAALLLGVAAGLAGLTKAVFVGFFPLLLILIGWMRWRKGRKENRHLAVALAAWLLVMAPWTIRNYELHGTLMPVSSGGGNSLLTGNNPYATGGWRLKEGFETWYAQQAAALGVPDVHSLSETARSALSGHIAWSFITTHPGDVLFLAAKKAYMFWVFPITNSDNNIPLQAVAVAADIVLAIGAAVGIVVTRRHAGRFLPLYSAIAFFFLTHVILHCESRFRLPLVPLVGVFFGIGMATVVRREILRALLADRAAMRLLVPLLVGIVIVYFITGVFFVNGIV